MIDRDVVIKTYFGSERLTVLRETQELIESLEQTAKILRIALQHDDLSNIAWHSAKYAPGLSARAEALRSTMHLIDGLDTHEARAKETK
jgi:uncharacterized protein (DUF1330 family)